MTRPPKLPRLETARLVLRPQQASDAALFRLLWSERDARVPPHRRLNAAGEPTERQIAMRIRDDGAQSNLLTVGRVSDATVIGYCGLVTADDAHDGEPELAFELHSSTHNQGFATEAGESVVEWARGASIPRLWATVWDWNAPSRRVLAKLGFRETGRIAADSPHGLSLVTLLEF